MENEKVFYKVDRWASKHSDIRKVIATRATEKTIWFMRNNHEQRELLSSSYYQYFTTEDNAKAIIDARNKSENERKNKKRINDSAPALLEALDGIIAIVNDSRGVAGFHLNGNTALWEEFEEIDAALAAIAAARGEV